MYLEEVEENGVVGARDCGSQSGVEGAASTGYGPERAREGEEVALAGTN